MIPRDRKKTEDPEIHGLEKLGISRFRSFRNSKIYADFKITVDKIVRIIHMNDFVNNY